MLRGTPEQLAELKRTIRALDAGPEGGGNFRILTLNRQDTRALAELLQDIVPKMTGNPVTVVQPGR
ncbi:MAG: hypothetical protein L0215_21950 [Gemmataceae bacterium]|nr:hypothetical protein [Gemmataceae bacterium]